MNIRIVSIHQLQVVYFTSMCAYLTFNSIRSHLYLIASRKKKKFISNKTDFVWKTNIRFHHIFNIFNYYDVCNDKHNFFKRVVPWEYCYEPIKSLSLFSAI